MAYDAVDRNDAYVTNIEVRAGKKKKRKGKDSTKKAKAGKRRN